MSYQTFHELHRNGLLVLANVWDAGSAELVQAAGAKALATTSAGLAFANGWPDGDLLPEPVLLSAIGAIARIARVPFTVDMEGGYSIDPSVVAERVLRVAELGVVGINLEDGAASVALTCAKIQAIKNRLVQRNLEVFINLRTDVYLLGLAPPAQRVEVTLERAEHYRAAGADGLFVPCIVAEAEIRALAQQSLPLNVMSMPTLPNAKALTALGVRRLSAGAALWKQCLGEMQALTRRFLHDGDSAPLFGTNSVDFATMNSALMERASHETR
jgi:2-methylisocitrate lyase-like PEP mutase family enzyme